MGYKPLDFITSGPEAGSFFTNILKDLREKGIVKEDFTEEEFLDYFLGRNFLSDNPPEKFRNFQKTVLENPFCLASILGFDTDYDSLVNNGSSIATEWKDLYTNGIILDKWCKNKQVYKPDSDFADVLLTTDKFHISRETVEHLPTNVFFLDLGDCPEYYPVIGAWVHVYSKNGFIQFQTLILKDHKNINEMLIYSVYDQGIYNSDNYVEFDLSKLPPEKYEMYSPLCSSSNNGLMVKESEIKRKEVVMLAMQLVNYITSEKPDIDESQYTKKTYRPSPVVKNKFREVQQWDVGIRYGTTIRAYKEKIHKQTQARQEGLSSRRSPLPHYRCAHWQHYWIGKRDNEAERTRVLKWIPPIFVGSGETIPTVHKIKK